MRVSECVSVSFLSHRKKIKNERNMQLWRGVLTNIRNASLDVVGMASLIRQQIKRLNNNN